MRLSVLFILDFYAIIPQVIKLEISMELDEFEIAYPDELLLSLKENPEEFESQARLLLAVKSFVLEKIPTGMAARMTGEIQGSRENIYADRLA